MTKKRIISVLLCVFLSVPAPASEMLTGETEADQMLFQGNTGQGNESLPIEALTEDSGAPENLQSEEPHVPAGTLSESTGDSDNILPEDVVPPEKMQLEDTGPSESMPPEGDGVSENMRPEEGGASENIRPEDSGTSVNIPPEDDPVPENTQMEGTGTPENILSEMAAFSEENMLTEESDVPEELMETQESSDPEEERIQPPEEYGGYEFAGYLDDGTPNFVWEGEGEPSVIGHELVFTKIPERKASDTSELPAVGSSREADSQPAAVGSSPEADDMSLAAVFTEYTDLPAVSVSYEAEAEEELSDGSSYAGAAARQSESLSLTSPVSPDSGEIMSGAPENENGGAVEVVEVQMADSPVYSLSSEGDADTALSMAGAARSDLPLVGATGSYNYLRSSRSRPYFHNYTAMSTTTDTTLVDGIHTETNGRRRAIRNGKYFIDGSLALNGIRYYADEDGYLLEGWLKTHKVNGETGYAADVDCYNFQYRYYDPSSCERVTGYRVVDGLGHYFLPDTTGVLAQMKELYLDGRLYYADRYGVCNRIKLYYGNEILSLANQNNDAYLAKNMVNAVDIETFTGQNGEYSFRPRWYSSKSSLELFGFTPIETPGGFYCVLADDSLKNRIGCIYRNVGRYKGREVDMRLTVTDYEFFDLGGEQEIGYFYVAKNAIGLTCTNTMSITADMTFLDHESQQKISLKGYATFSDIDIEQSLTILSPVDEVYVDHNCKLYKDPGSLAFSAPYTESRNGSIVNDSHSEYWVQVNYTADHLTFRFGSGFENYRFIDGNRINCEARAVWKRGYTGNPFDYHIGGSNGNLEITWQGLHFKRLGRVSIPDITKTVTDSDEIKVLENRLLTADERFTYTLSHNVPAEFEQFFYSSYQIKDVVNNDLSIVSGSWVIKDDQDTDVTGRFAVSVSGQTITADARPEWLADEDFYDNNYHLSFSVAVRDIDMFRSYRNNDYQVKNKGQVTFERPAGKESKESNETITRYRPGVLSVKKTDQETGELLEGAEFALFPYNASTGRFDTVGTGYAVTYNRSTKRYESEGLPLTARNKKGSSGEHAFLLKETTVPEGYEDNGFEKEIIFSETDVSLEVTVENAPDVPPLGKIIITKRILESEIIWAHGNPVFLFAAEGTDIRGDHHRYEDFLQFSQGGYTVDGHGYATLTLTIDNVPVGTYQIYELGVVDYYLSAADAGSANVTITNVGPPMRGKEPKDTAYGTGVLTKETPAASIIFTDKKGDDHGYRHTDVVRNSLPLRIS